MGNIAEPGKSSSELRITSSGGEHVPPRSESTSANQTDLEAAGTPSMAPNQPPPYDHDPVEGRTNSIMGEHLPPPYDHDDRYEKFIVAVCQLLSLGDAIRASYKASEMANYTKILWYILVTCCLMALAFYRHALSVCGLRRSTFVSIWVIATTYAATCFAVLTIIALELPDKLRLWFYVIACSIFVPGVIYRAIH